MAVAANSITLRSITKMDTWILIGFVALVAVIWTIYRFARLSNHPSFNQNQFVDHDIGHAGDNFFAVTSADSMLGSSEFSRADSDDRRGWGDSDEDRREARDRDDDDGWGDIGGGGGSWSDDTSRSDDHGGSSDD
jgi:hypothetical protein